MKLPLKEPRSPRYLYINQETNTVHLLMPIMSGTDIGLDNTCKSVYSLQEFFGLMGANKQAHALGELEDYQEALVFDIKYLPDGAEKARKENRLKQVTHYISLIKSIQNEARIKKPLTEVFPRYPAPLETLMGSNESNLYRIILRPQEQDIQLRATAIKPVFSVPHDSYGAQGDRIVCRSLVYETLAHRYKDLVFNKPKKSQEQLISRVVARLGGAPVDLEQIKEILSDEIRSYLGIVDGVRFDQTQATKYTASVAATQEYIDEQMAFDEANPGTHQQYIEALLQYCTPNLFDVIGLSPFYSINKETQAKKEEALSILTQLFLAELNIIYRANGLTEANFGSILEADVDLMRGLAEEVKKALTEEASVEEALMAYLQSHLQAFQITNPLSLEAKDLVVSRFKAHYQTIKDSPHFDEFLFLSDKVGPFVSRAGFITTHVAQLIQAGFLDKLDEPQRAFVQQVQQDFASVPKPQNILPPHNERVFTEINLDLSPMSSDALQALYEDINGYQDPKIKEACLVQLQQERPDFKPPIEAKAFLQHVAYGQQEEAEALLKKHPEWAQDLLKAHQIAFTDYSGRTFGCTAYEYAYWAKDTHMQRMLEKYIRADEDTRQFILGQVQKIEELVNPLPAANLLAQPKPRGVHYTTRDKEGTVTDHWEAHFDLTPLKKALKHYVDEYNQRPEKSDADWEVLDKIWVEEVGGAQREVPAHIAHEYCHPDRSFYDVTKNKALLDASNPAHLKRQLNFYNYGTGNDDVWFTPNSYASNSGLGFSFGIFRRSMRAGGTGGGREAGVRAIDLAALTAIDEVRTSELNKSRDNLSQPLIVQDAPAHGI